MVEISSVNYAQVDEEIYIKSEDSNNNKIECKINFEEIIEENLVEIESQNRTNTNTDDRLKLFGYTFNISKPQFVIIVLLSTHFFLTSSYYSLFAPFFPSEALKKGISQTQIGIIFGIFEFVILVLSPVFGKYVINS